MCEGRAVILNLIIKKCFTEVVISKGRKRGNRELHSHLVEVYSRHAKSILNISASQGTQNKLESKVIGQM